MEAASAPSGNDADTSATCAESTAGPSQPGVPPDLAFLVGDSDEALFAKKVLAMLTREDIIASLKSLRDDCKQRKGNASARELPRPKTPPRKAPYERPSLLSFLRAKQAEPAPAHASDSPLGPATDRLLDARVRNSRTPRRLHHNAFGAELGEQIESMQREQSEAMAELFKEYTRMRKREKQSALEREKTAKALQDMTAERDAALAEAGRLRNAEQLLQKEGRTTGAQLEALETELERTETEKTALLEKFETLRGDLEARLAQATWRASALQDQLAAEHEHAVEAGEREKEAAERLEKAQRAAEESKAEAAAEKELRRRDRQELQARISTLEAELVAAKQGASAETVSRQRAEIESLRGQLKRAADRERDEGREKEEAAASLQRLREELERLKEAQGKGSAKRGGGAGPSFAQKRVEELEGQVAGLQEALGRAQGETASLRLRLQVLEGLRTAAADEGTHGDVSRALAAEQKKTAALQAELEEARKKAAAAAAAATAAPPRSPARAQERKATNGRALLRAEADSGPSPREPATSARKASGR
eukprot:tig00000079_g2791.t1